jgi:hypothetical protein
MKLHEKAGIEGKFVISNEIFSVHYSMLESTAHSYQGKVSLARSTILVRQGRRAQAHCERATACSKGKKRKPLVLLQFSLSVHDEDTGKSLILREVREWLGGGYRVIVFIVCDDCSKGTRCWEEIKKYLSISERYLDEADKSLLCFSSTIMTSTTLAQRLRAEGCRTAVSTSLSGGISFKGTGDNQKLSFLGRAFRKSIEDNDAIFLASIGDLEHGISRKKGKAAAHLNGLPVEKRKVATGITIVPRVTEFSVDFNELADGHVRRDNLLSSLARQGISLDMINISYSMLHFILDERRSPEALEILRHEEIPFLMKGDLAKLSINGIGMKGTPGVMARIYGALESVHVEVLRNTDSHITISCLITEDDLPAAIRALMNEFGLESSDFIIEIPKETIC